MMKEFTKILAYVLVGVLLCLNVYQCHRGRTLPTSGVLTDTLTVYDTARVEIPAPKEEKPLGSVTAKLPVSVPKVSENERKLQETVQILRDSLANFGKTVPDDKEDNFPNKTDVAAEDAPDSVTVQIPITQRVYETDRYRAVVSGYQPSLDDLLIYQPTQVVRIKDKPKRWGIGVQVGYGITVGKQPQFSPYIGIGVSYNLFQF